MEFEDLTPEQQERFKACKTPEEFIAFAKENGFELSDEALEGIAGGALPLLGPWRCRILIKNPDGKKPTYPSNHQIQQADPESADQ